MPLMPPLIPSLRRCTALAVALNVGLLCARDATRPPQLALNSAAVLVQDQRTGECLVQKRAGDVVPIASLTKLMTAMVILDAQLDLRTPLTILEEDKDTLRHSKSRLPVGTELTRGEALQLALMASENRAAHALGRTWPGGLEQFVMTMNAKAQALGLTETRFEDPAGLSAGNLSCARDLARIVDAAHHYPQIRAFTTQEGLTLRSGRRELEFHNTNMLLESSRWHIGLSKTGFIDESGQCLVMQAEMAQRPVLIVLLDANGHHSRFNDANRIRQWMEGPDLAPVRAKARLQAKARGQAKSQLQAKAQLQAKSKGKTKGKAKERPHPGSRPQVRRRRHRA